MGIDAHALNALEWLRSRRGRLGQTVTIGRMAVHLGPRERKRWTGAADDEVIVYGEHLLTHHFDASAVESIDNSSYEGATHVADMNLPLPDALRGQYDCVLDFGCLEHIFDIRQALHNIGSLTRIGGTILHVLPANGYCGHGFYQFSPELFFSYYSERNGFARTEVFIADLLDTRHWYKVAPPKDGARVNVQSSRETLIIVCTDRVMEVPAAIIQQSDYVHEWTTSNPSPKKRSSRAIFRAKLRERLMSIPLLGPLTQRLSATLSTGASQRLAAGNRNLRRIRVSANPRQRETS